jgi:hypothetical protein
LRVPTLAVEVVRELKLAVFDTRESRFEIEKTLRKNTLITFDPRTAVFMNGIVRVSKKNVVFDALDVKAPGTITWLVVVRSETLRKVTFSMDDTLRLSMFAVVTIRFGDVSELDA